MNVQGLDFNGWKRWDREVKRGRERREEEQMREEGRRERRMNWLREQIY